MPHATPNDGVKLYCEEAGIGPTIVSVHEFAADYRAPSSCFQPDHADH
jgi:hypothetical protein